LSGIFFYPVRSAWLDVRTYLFVVLFAAGNLLLPQLCHLTPSGGRIFLPIYFFTLIASYKFGWKVGLMTALVSPVLNSVLFGMPMEAVLPSILIKSVLLSLIASYVSLTFKRLSLFHLLLVVVSYQLIGSAIEWAISQSFTIAIGDLTIGLPGMVIQIFGGWWLLKQLARYGRR
ncbi:MAG: hypothetical protein ACXVBJ_15415, partial [Flavisolibacter sp.]